ncbi:MAG TPA: PAS domain S-box protein [Xanthobacteraceae bacterium]|nr:PAS domain S-box protein [Xanthobacteraceae bacterium]
MEVEKPSAAASSPSNCDLSGFSEIFGTARGLRALLDALPAAIYLTDAAGRMVYYNEAAVEIWGRRPELGAARWCGPWKLFWPDGSPFSPEQSPMAAALREARAIKGAEVVGERADGTRVRLAPHPVPIFDAAGTLIGGLNLVVDISEHKRAEEALRARGAELEAVIDGTPFMLARLGRDMRYRFISRAYARMIGRRSEDVIGRHVADVLGQEGFAAVRPHIEKVLRGEPTEYELEIRFPGLGPRLLRGFYTPVLDEAGRADGWIASLLDIGEQRRAEEVRRQLASIVDSSGDAIFSEDIDGLIVSWNRGAERLYGYAATEVIGQSITLLLPAGLHDEERQILARIARGEHIEHYETVRRRKDGRLIEVSLTISPIKNAEGAIVGASKIARDITERMQAEQARRAAERELRALSERLEMEVEKRTLERDRIWNVSEDLLGVSNFEGHFISINPAWTRLLGWSEQEIKSMHVNELRHSDDAAHSMAGRAQLAQGVSTVRMENRFRHKDGSWRWISWTMTAENGLIYVAGRHVTVEKEAAAALEQAQRQAAQSQKMEALGQLTGGVAHDFNNLLMIVSGHAQRLQKRLTEQRDVRALEAIQIAATRGESLTRQLLSFSRGQPLNPTVLSPAETVNGIRDVLSGSLHVNIALAIDVSATVWPVRVDKSEIELALVNLVLNARDAMPEGGRLTISAENVRLVPADARDGLTGEFVALRVADTGCGIPDEIVGKVFEPFFTTKAAEKGTGLGLSQVYGFARRSGGTVALASDAGRGTTVSLYLPRSHGQVERPAAEDFEQSPAAGEETVLVVEDNDDVRAVAVSLLEQLGYRTAAVESAAAALARLAAGEIPDAIFTDVVLPGEMDGLALARAVRERHPDVPTVLTTGYAKIFETEPEFPVLRKPYQITALARVIRAALDSAKLARPALAS